MSNPNPPGNDDNNGKDDHAVPGFLFPSWCMKRIIPFCSWATSNKLAFTVGTAAGFKFLNEIFLAGVRRFSFGDEWLEATCAACSVGLIHSAIVVTLSYEALRRNGWNWFKQVEPFDMGGPFTAMGATAAMICNSYMIYDFSYVIPYEPDPLILFHHIGSLLYLTSALISGKGECASLLCIFLGEGTNPATNVYNITKALTDKGVFTGVGARHYLAAFNAATLGIARGIYAPYMLGLQLFRGLFTQKRGAASLPFALRAFWFALPTFFIVGTFLYLHGEVKNIAPLFAS